MINNNCISLIRYYELNAKVFCLNNSKTKIDCL